MAAPPVVNGQHGPVYGANNTLIGAIPNPNEPNPRVITRTRTKVTGPDTGFWGNTAMQDQAASFLRKQGYNINTHADPLFKAAYADWHLGQGKRNPIMFNHKAGRAPSTGQTPGAQAALKAAQGASGANPGGPPDLTGSVDPASQVTIPPLPGSTAPIPAD